MRHPDRAISGVGQLLEFLSADLAGSAEPIWFRGQADAAWNLDPKFLRNDPDKPESHLLNRFRQSAAYILQSPQSSLSDFDWLFLMQHHGAPTRLLDWTESVLVGLYFAVEDKSDTDAALWAMAPCELNSLSNYQPEYSYEIPSFEDSQLQGYSPKTIASETKTRLLPMAAIGVRNSPRMHSQQGVFTIAHRGEPKIDQLAVDRSDSTFLWRYVIRAGSKASILRELRLLGIGKFQLFPELTSIAEGITR